MTRKTAADFDQALLILFEAFVHGAIDRTDLSAAVSFYAIHPATDESALKAAGVAFTAHHYAGTLHGIHNDTTPRFDAAAVKLAWERTLAFFNQQLRG